jgi:hypothetical protein
VALDHKLVKLRELSVVLEETSFAIRIFCLVAEEISGYDGLMSSGESRTGNQVRGSRKIPRNMSP